MVFVSKVPVEARNWGLKGVMPCECEGGVREEIENDVHEGAQKRVLMTGENAQTKSVKMSAPGMVEDEG